MKLISMKERFMDGTLNMGDWLWIALSPFIALVLMVVLVPVAAYVTLTAVLNPLFSLLAMRWPWFKRLIPQKLR